MPVSESVWFFFAKYLQKYAKVALSLMQPLGCGADMDDLKSYLLSAALGGGLLFENGRQDNV
jgi:hypothetical protein